jgi:hypothetical protein
MKAILFAAGLIALLASCETTADRINDPGGGGGGETVDVVFVVEGEGRANVTYGSINSTSQKTVNLPWEQTQTLDGTFDVASLLAQRESGGRGKIQCRIENTSGEVLSESEASGPYAVCNVSV